MSSDRVPRVFRFAPSPNGYLHLGHAYSALLNFDLAKRCGGRFLLRIEDIDAARSRFEYEEAIYEDLAWLGIRWEEPVRRQSEHFDDYAAALAKLEALGLLYCCGCSRGDVARATSGRDDWPRDPDGVSLYPGTCRDKPRAANIGEKTVAVRRLNMGRAVALASGDLSWREHGLCEEAHDVRAAPMDWGDVVLARKDVPTSYHISVVVDDTLQGVTDIVRGRDLFHATSVHRLLQRLLGLPEPVYHHHDLVRDESGQKLAKSCSSKTLRSMRSEGASAADVRRALGLGDSA
jgi:glutamyl-Q tRNA(Asp) synthetase